MFFNWTGNIYGYSSKDQFKVLHSEIIEYFQYLFSSHAKVEEISTWQNDEKQISK